MRDYEIDTVVSMKHTCHARDCTTPVPPKMFMCKKHWYMVPVELRQQVWAAYRPGQENNKTPSHSYLVIALNAIEAVALKEGKE